MDYPFYVTNNFSFFAFKIHSLSLTLDSLIILCLSMTLLGFFFSWRFFSFFNLYVHFFSQIWEVFCHDFCKVLFHILSLSSPKILIMCVFIPLIISHKALSHSLLFFMLFCFYSSDLLISNDLPSSLLILSFA